MIGGYYQRPPNARMRLWCRDVTVDLRMNCAAALLSTARYRSRLSNLWMPTGVESLTDDFILLQFTSLADSRIAGFREQRHVVGLSCGLG
jgi:hypothetical protein